MDQKKLLTLGIAAVSLMGLTACSNQQANIGKHVHLSETYNASKAPTKKGDDSTLHVAEINDAPFAGMTLPTLQDNQEDVDVYSPGGEGNLFNTNNNHKIVNGGLANLKLNKKNNTGLITIRKNAKWSNGSPVIAKDVEYPYEILANPKSKSQQFSTDMDDIQGMNAYHKGKASTISGITFPDGTKGKKTLIHFTHLSPALEYNGNDFMWNAVEPYEHLKDIPISKLPSSKQVRKDPIFTGPYKLKKQIQGEATSWVPNKYYWGKKPHIKHIAIQVVSSSNTVAALKSKKYDFTFGNGSSDYSHIKPLKDYSEVGQPGYDLNDLGFVVGHGSNNGHSTMTPSKMSNVNLRRAMLYSINLNLLAKKFGNGLSYRANTLMPPAFHKYHNSYSSTPGFPYNMAKAKKLLKDAGYKKRNGSKYVTKPNGKKLVIYFGCMQGNDADKATDEYFLQQWQKLGLDAKFADGKPMEMNSFYSTLEKPKQKTMDVFEAAYSLGTEPTQDVMSDPDDPDNSAHMNTKENNKLIKEMNDKKSFNLKYRIKIFHKWQKYMNKMAIYGPESYGIDWTAVNHRVTGFSYKGSNNNFWGNLGLDSAHLK
ncbi:oligopeptide ABC transporter substrate-binding protein [uncultured bacterium]|uniref:Oligopeptide ABC transporter substrate-binding protein n=1 Tax=Acetilactobacillus jinshanensis TaxID=1720083 RepID=A0A4P6ZMB8_9LACO|nr:oligopeptide ABC transporter substrate-binding protein [Acetilactobacillus jinshanensis]URL61904.1 oligopeptide ABC transporter substrate-binding protein [uncultured bacterium]